MKKVTILMPGVDSAHVIRNVDDDIGKLHEDGLDTAPLTRLILSIKDKGREIVYVGSTTTIIISDME